LQPRVLSLKNYYKQAKAGQEAKFEKENTFKIPRYNAKALQDTYSFKNKMAVVQGKENLTLGESALRLAKRPQ
jgi:hypothetical protein